MTLPKFEDEPVTRSTMKVVKTGDGLSASLKLAPIPLAIGSEIHIVMRGHVSAVAHVEKDDELTRQHTVTCDAITMVDGDAVEDLLTAAALAAERAKAAADGQTAIDDESDQ